MTCQRCDSARILQVSSHASDSHTIQIHDYSPHPDYLPSDLGLGDNPDNMEMSVCLDCGQLQGGFPLDETDLEREANIH